ncbi:protein required for normal CLN1 and CLN2 G1 cyclin expression [Tieghemiomyces parasiticus]|uniref:Protein required for normal CLN1 and CLN2 G1 cyclin expression n=1 Tax=Tieghemiomyces parasiticus TaxID=78921 RepID=A0A9W8DLW3_9FUNG|nr:protein required for normal CLN1 and CLN2 G1 cyclin expression [Tieghemiomyces parasiticus]
MAATVIEIPLQGSVDNVLEIDCSQLPPQASELCEILIQEEAPLRFYLQLAIEYYKRNQADEAIHMLKAGLSNAKGASNYQPKIQLLNCLASIYLQKARRSHLNPLVGASAASAVGEEEAAAEQEQYFELATALFNEADRIDPNQPTTWLGKGILYWLRRQPDLALSQFSDVLEQQPHSVAAKFGLARVYFSQKRYRDALALYQQLLSQHPTGVPDPRLGLGLCYHKLDMVRQAKLAFERAVEINPRQVTARVLLAILYFNEFKAARQRGEDPVPAQLLEVGLGYLRAAYVHDRRHPVVADLMADYLFTRQDYAGSIAFATAGALAADMHAIEAESHYQLGRNYHRLEDFDRALTHYRRATDLNPQHQLTQFGLGQVYLHRGELTAALEIFQGFVKRFPDFIEAWNLVGSIFARMPDHQQDAQAAFGRVLALVGERTAEAGLAVSPGLYMDIGRTYENLNLGQALQAYQSALRLYEPPAETNGAVASTLTAPPTLLNNIGALLHLQKDLPGAEVHYERALTAAASDPVVATTVKYNLARLREAQDRPSDAQTLFKALVADHPAYLDAYLRMGVLAQRAGDPAAAETWFLDAVDVAPKATLPAILLGLHFVAQRDLNTGRRTLERVLQDLDRHDTMALTAVGNIHLRTARGQPDSKVRHKFYRHAYRFFETALTHDHRNLYAAHGLGILLADRGRYAEARSTLTQVREACGDTQPAVTFNLGHVLVGLGQYRSAVLQYETAIKKLTALPASHPVHRELPSHELYLCLSRAQYTIARSEKNESIMAQALASAERALELQPDDLTVSYDLALVAQAYAQLVADKPTDQRSVADITQALVHLERSHELFEALARHPGVVRQPLPGEPAPKDPKPEWPYDRKLTEQRMRFGESLTSKLRKHLEEQQRLAAERESTIEATRRRREEERKRVEAEQEAQHAREAEELRQIEESRQRIQEEVRLRNEELSRAELENSDGEPAENARSRTKRQRAEAVREAHDHADGGEDFDPDRATPVRPRKTAGSGRRLSRKRGADEHLSNDDGEADSNGPPADPYSGSGNKKYKSKAFIDSDEDVA